jgi:hypothetical protein
MDGFYLGGIEKHENSLLVTIISMEVMDSRNKKSSLNGK